MKRKIIFLIILLLLLCTSVLFGGNLKKEKEKEIIVLMYHHLLPEDKITGIWENNSAVLSVESFEKQMKYLYDNEYNILSLKELKNCIYNDIPIKSKGVFITFDDGYKSNFEYAYPILKRYNFKATIFLISSLIEKNYNKKFLFNKLQYGSFKELVDCSDVFTYGDHTFDLHKIDYNTKKPLLLVKSNNEIELDIRKSNEILSDYIDTDTKAFSFPYGAYNKLSIEILKSHGYKLSFITEKGKVDNNTNPYLITRYSISNQDDFDKIFKIK